MNSFNVEIPENFSKNVKLSIVLGSIQAWDENSESLNIDEVILIYIRNILKHLKKINLIIKFLFRNS